MAIDGRVDAKTEYVLVVLCQSARRDDVTPWGRLARININNCDDTRRSNLDRDSTSLIELECEDVFIVCKGDNKLYNKFAVSGCYCTGSTEVCMLPPNTTVLLVDADNILCQRGL